MPGESPSPIAARSSSLFVSLLAVMLFVTPATAGLQLRVVDGAAASQSSSSQPAQPEILVPSQGRPVFSTPIGAFSALLHLSEYIGTAPRIWLQNSQYPKLRYPLLQAGGLKTFGDGYASVQLCVPNSVPPGLYDLVVVGSLRETSSRRSVCIVSSYKTTFRFVHLSNMNIGDPTAMDFDPLLPDEINLLAPEFIIATGDYTEWARLFDNPNDWQRVLDYMARFQAPVYMLCGDHDHQASFTHYVANSLIGTIDYGRYHGLLLLDHGYHPIEQDEDQVRWVLQDLAANQDKAFNFIVTHSDELGLVRCLREMNRAEQVFRDNRVKMILAGGNSDWDYKEFSSLLAGLPGLTFIRTAQSSTAASGRASGVSHYRVIEVSNDRISYVYPTERLDPSVQHSIPSGRIRTIFDGPNDGTREVVTANVASVLNRAWNDCRIWLHVRKNAAGSPPAVAGGTLLQYLDLGTHWAVLAGFDLPDRSSVTLQAGPADQLIPPSLVYLELLCKDQLVFSPRQAPFGLTYFTCNTPLVLRVSNRSKHTVRAWPVVRLNGTTLQVSSSEPLPLTLPPMSDQLLRASATLGQLALGAHTLQAYLLDDPLRRLTTRLVVLLAEPETPQPATQPASQPAVASRPASTQPAVTSKT